MTELLTRLLDICVSLVNTFGYAGIFFSVVLESFFAPIPSEAVMGLGGYLVYQGKLEFLWVVLFGALGKVAGSALIYALGYYGGEPFLRRFGKYIGVGESEMARTEKWFNRYGNWAILLTQVVPIMRSIISFPAGLLRVNFWQFCLYTFLGAFIWNGFLTYLGGLMGANWERISDYIKPFEGVVIVLLVVGLGYWLYRKYRARRSAQA